MRVPGPGAPGPQQEGCGKMVISSRRKSRGLFMTHVNPVDRLSSPQRVRKAVERVSHHSVDALHARLLEGFDEIFGCSIAHQLCSPIARTSSPRGARRDGGSAENLSATRGTVRFAVTPAVVSVT